MSGLDYIDHEVDFLEAMATHYQFGGNVRRSFTFRFLECNASKDDQTLAKDVLKVNAHNLRDDLKIRIYPKLEEDGCNFGTAQRSKWKVGMQWLREVKYPQWIDPLLIWQNLWEKAKDYSAFQVKVYEPKKAPTEAILGIRRVGNKPTEELAKIKVDSPIHYNLSLENASYVIVLEKFISGKIACLCPSIDQKQLHFPEKQVIIPDINSEFPYYKTDYTIGIEELLAILSPKQPNFDWLQPKDDDFHYLNPVELNELLTYINQHNEDVNLLKMAYRITA